MAAAIREFVGDLPLALRLVGSYLDATGMSAAEYLQLPESEQLSLLDPARKEFPERSVLTVLSRSLNRVTPAAQEACALLGVLALAPFDGQEMAAILGDGAGAALRQLVQFGLLGREAGGAYSVSHALVYRYAHEYLQVTAEAVTRLAEYYAEVAERQSARGLVGYQELDKVRPHMMACLEACARAEAWREIVGLVWVVDDYLDLQGYGLEYQMMLTQGIIAAQQLGAPYYQRAFTSHLGLAHGVLGRIKESITYHEKSLQIAREIGDLKLIGLDLGNLGLAYADLSELKTAIAYHQQALDSSREIGDKWVEGNQLGNNFGFP